MNFNPGVVLQIENKSMWKDKTFNEGKEAGFGIYFNWKASQLS